MEKITVKRGKKAHFRACFDHFMGLKGVGTLIRDRSSGILTHLAAGAL
jgi:hypothetical protein